MIEQKMAIIGALPKWANTLLFAIAVYFIAQFVNGNNQMKNDVEQIKIYMAEKDQEAKDIDRRVSILEMVASKKIMAKFNSHKGLITFGISACIAIQTLFHFLEAREQTKQKDHENQYEIWNNNTHDKNECEIEKIKSELKNKSNCKN